VTAALRTAADVDPELAARHSVDRRFGGLVRARPALQSSVMAKKMLCPARKRLRPGIFASSASACSTRLLIRFEATLSSMSPHVMS
jgi:hypothetical protein